MERLLIRFAKEEPVRFVGHLDLMRVFERAMRRSKFPIAYSQGFNPRPRMSFASALTLGATSEWELCQLDLAEPCEQERVVEAVGRLREQMPNGVKVREVWELPLEKRNPYIQVTAAEYELVSEGDDARRNLAGFIEEHHGVPRALEASLREPSLAASGGESAGMVSLVVKLPAGERGGVRIRDLIAEIEAAVPGTRVPRLHRTRLWCEREPADRGFA